MSQQIKIMLAYVVLHYEIQPLEEKRPVNRYLGDSITPPRDTKMMVRRRTLEQM